MEYVYETVSWTHIFILVLAFVLLKQENGAGHIKELISLFFLFKCTCLLVILSTFRRTRAYKTSKLTNLNWKPHSAIFNTVIYVSAPLALFLSLLSLSHSLSYFLFFQQKVSSQIEQMQADSSQEVHPSEPLCLYLRHASTDCEGTSFPLSLTGRCACVWV